MSTQPIILVLSEIPENVGQMYAIPNTPENFELLAKTAGVYGNIGDAPEESENAVLEVMSRVYSGPAEHWEGHTSVGVWAQHRLEYDQMPAASAVVCCGFCM